MDGDRLPELARQHLQEVLAGRRGLKPADLQATDGALAGDGACFVTLTANKQLRGCIGTLAAHRSLAEDLLKNAEAAAIRDPRFLPVERTELDRLEIEVSILSEPKPFPYQDGQDLLARLLPGVHGVILIQRGKRATFLPQVWEQLPDPVQFLSHLCRKAGLGTDCWQQHPEILVYTVEKFEEHGRI